MAVTTFDKLFKAFLSKKKFEWKRPNDDFSKETVIKVMCRLHLQGEYIEEWQLSNDNIKRYIETYPETLTDEYSDKVITFMARVYSGMFEQIIAE